MATRVLKALLIAIALLAALFIGAELALFDLYLFLTLNFEAFHLDKVFTLLLIGALWLPFQILLSGWRVDRWRARFDEVKNDAQEARQKDQLTGLLSRQHLLDALDAQRDTGELPPTVMVLNISRFRAINENHDHKTGDRVLIEVSRRIAECAAPEDMCARIGGAEFAVLLGPGRHLKSAKRLARELMEELGKPLVFGIKNLWVRTNIGITPGPERGEHDDAILCADKALRMAISAGPGHICIFDADARAASIREEKVRESLKHSLEHDEVEPVFQPIVNLDTNRIDGVEVLSRWPKCKEKISPFEFILAAEKDGSIGLLTDQILAKACDTLASLDEDIWMSFNLSAQEFVDPELPERILSTLSLYGIETHRFIVEITETAVMEDLDMAERVISTFRDAGVKIALDDFGTGASSLTLLARLPLDRMKIDQTFVGHIEQSTSNAQIVTSMMVLAESMGLSVVVEGIERPEEHDFLYEHGCKYGQGYLYGRPCPASKLAARLAMGPDYLRLLEKTG